MNKKTNEDQPLENKNAGRHTVFSIIAILLFVSFAQLVWHSYWNKNHAFSIISIIAAIIVLLVPLQIYFKQYLRNKKSVNQMRGMKKKFLNPVGIFLLFIEKKYYEDYYRLFLRMKPNTEQVYMIQKSLMPAFIISIVFGILLGGSIMLYSFIWRGSWWWILPAIIVASFPSVITWIYLNSIENGLDKYLQG
jgi:hypothetical protein